MINLIHSGPVFHHTMPELPAAAWILCRRQGAHCLFVRHTCIVDHVTRGQLDQWARVACIGSAASAVPQAMGPRRHLLADSRPQKAMTTQPRDCIDLH